MRRILLMICVSVSSTVAMAQSTYSEGFKIGGGITLAVPVVNLKGYSVGAGFDLLAQYGIANKVALTGDFGYTTIFAKDKDLASFDILPLRVGVRVFPASQYYIGAKIGVGLGVGKNSGSSTAYAFGAGLVMSPKLDVSAFYEGYSKSGYSPGYLGIRLGYFFKG